MAWAGPTPQRPFPSLGWGVLAWTYRYLPSPSDEHRPLVYTVEQARRIVRWYELDPDTGEFIYLRLILEDAKGWGKSPMAASLMLAEFAGPTRFVGWDDDGEPIGGRWGDDGSPPPLIQIAAVSEDQTENTYGALYAMLTMNDSSASKALAIDAGLTRIRFRGGRRGSIEPVTARAGSKEGFRLTAGVADETHLWVQRSGGHRLYRVLRRNLAKMNGRLIETTNAPVIGEGSVAEMHDPEHPEPDVLHYAPRPAGPEPDPSWEDEQLKAALDQVYGGVPWSDTRRLVRELRDRSTPWDDALRFWFNIRTTGNQRAVDPRIWAALAQPQEVPPGTVVGLGFDGSISRDATALVGCTRTGYLFPVHIWERPADADPDWRIPRQEVAEAVERSFAVWRVGLLLADPPRWATEIEDWAERYALGKKPEDQRVLAFDTNQSRRMAPALDRFLTAIRESAPRPDLPDDQQPVRLITHAGDEALTRHVVAARLQKVRLQADESDGRSMYVLTKGEDRAWIDAAVASVLAYQAAMTMTEPVVRRKGGWAFAG